MLRFIPHEKLIGLPGPSARSARVPLSCPLCGLPLIAAPQRVLKELVGRYFRRLNLPDALRLAVQLNITPDMATQASVSYCSTCQAAYEWGI